MVGFRGSVSAKTQSCSPSNQKKKPKHLNLGRPIHTKTSIAKTKNRRRRPSSRLLPGFAVGLIQRLFLRKMTRRCGRRRWSAACSCEVVGLEVLGHCWATFLATRRRGRNRGRASGLCSRRGCSTLMLFLIKDFFLLAKPSSALLRKKGRKRAKRRNCP